jgi:hypothetical protein
LEAVPAPRKKDLPTLRRSTLTPIRDPRLWPQTGRSDEKNGILILQNKKSYRLAVSMRELRPWTWTDPTTIVLLSGQKLHPI